MSLRTSAPDFLLVDNLHMTWVQQKNLCLEGRWWIGHEPFDPQLSWKCLGTTPSLWRSNWGLRGGDSDLWCWRRGASRCSHVLSFCMRQRTSCSKQTKSGKPTTKNKSYRMIPAVIKSKETKEAHSHIQRTYFQIQSPKIPQRRCGCKVQSKGANKLTMTCSATFTDIKNVQNAQDMLAPPRTWRYRSSYPRANQHKYIL